MNAAAAQIESLTLERGFPAMIATIQFANWGLSTGFGSAEQSDRFLRDATRSPDLPAVLVARRGEKFLDRSTCSSAR